MSEIIRRAFPQYDLPAALEIARVILPASSTSHERGVLAADLASQSHAWPELVLSIWNPETCPLPLLPYLAWALSVDSWDDEWDEATKRAVVGSSPFIHRRKGTVAAVRAALAPLALNTAIKEWFEDPSEIKRGHFVVTALVTSLEDLTENLITASKLRSAREFATGAKPLSRPMTLLVGVGIQATIGAAIRSAAVRRVQFGACTYRPDTGVSALGAAMRSAGYRMAYRGACVGRPTTFSSAIGASLRAASVRFAQYTGVIE